MLQSLSFRLHDSVPRDVVNTWKAELGLLARSSAQHRTRRRAAETAETETAELNRQRQIELSKRIAHYEDRGHGACWLGLPRIAQLVENALLHFDGQRYRLLAWCVMPNHVHGLIETREGFPLATVLHSWKSYTAEEANKLMGRSGPFYEREYLDRYIRHAEHYVQAVHYIEQNPVRAGLVEHAADWQFSSARYRDRQQHP